MLMHWRSGIIYIDILICLTLSPYINEEKKKNGKKEFQKSFLIHPIQSLSFYSYQYDKYQNEFNLLEHEDMHYIYTFLFSFPVQVTNHPMHILLLASCILGMSIWNFYS